MHSPDAVNRQENCSKPSGEKSKPVFNGNPQRSNDQTKRRLGTRQSSTGR